MSARRIALVSEHASPLASLGGVDAGGQNVHVDALAANLAGAGADVVVHTRRDDPRLPTWVQVSTGYRVHHVDAGPAEPMPKDEIPAHLPSFAAALARSWRGDRPDLVHAHFWMSGVASLAQARLLGVPIVQTFHALGAVKRRHQGQADTSPARRESDERTLARSVDAVIATCSDEVVELRALGAPLERVAVVPCGVDPERFTPFGPVRERPTTGHRLVVLARLVPRKGVDDVIRALSKLPTCELVVAGGPPADLIAHDEEIRRLRAVANAVGVGDRVAFLGSVARDEVPALLRSADVVVCPPWYEPFGIVPLEAMACGVPVIGTAVGGLLDTVLPGETGLLVQPRDPEGLAAAISFTLDRPELRRRWGMAGTRRVRERFTWPRVGTATAAVYDQVIDRCEKAVPA